MSGSSSSFDLFDYPLKSIHYLVATKNHTALSAIISSLPRLEDPKLVNSIDVTTAQEEIANNISLTLNSRDNDKRDTPLHIAVRLNDLDAVKILLSVAGGSDVTLPNAKGCTPFEEAILRRSCSSISSSKIIKRLVAHQRQMLWYKWRPRLPLLSKALKDDVPDFYLQISLAMDSHSLTRRINIWKHGGNFVVDTPIFPCIRMNAREFGLMKEKRIVFISDGNKSLGCGAGEFALLIKNIDGKESSSKPIDLIEQVQKSTNQSEVEHALGRNSVAKTKIDLSKAKLRERSWCIFRMTKDVGKWRNCKVYKGENFPLIYYSWYNRHNYYYSNVTGDSDDSGIQEWSYKCKNIKPSIWFNDEFPLKIDAMDPILSILGQEMRDFAKFIHILKTTGNNSFPVKISLPVELYGNLVATVTAFSSKPKEWGTDPFDNPFGTGGA